MDNFLHPRPVAKGSIGSMTSLPRAGVKLTAMYHFTLSMMALWTLVVGGSLAWNIHDERTQTLALARQEALATFNKDQAFRFWAAKHGGLYVPVTTDTPPNPYLSHVPGRDITLPSGKKLTLMNPAYALRQLMHDFEQDYGIQGRITSLLPLNPGNRPDAWEERALRAFETGSTEITEVVAENSGTRLRLMRPMVTKQACLKCHAHQGYREGDIRGGVGITLPLDPLLAEQRKAERDMLATHAVLWLSGIGGIGFVYSRSKRNVIERARTEEAVRESRERFSNLIETTNDFVWETDVNGVFSYASPKIRDVLGYDPQDVAGKPLFDLIVPGDREHTAEMKAAFEARLPFSFLETVNRHKQGREVVLESSGVPFFDSQGNLRGYRGVGHDITARKRTDGENRRLRDFFENIAESIVTGVWVADREDVVFYANRAAGAMAGLEPRQIIGAPVLRNSPEPTREAFLPVYLRAKEAMQPVRYDSLRVMTPGGIERYLSGWLIPRTHEGRYDGMICTVEDVTEQVRAESRRKQIIETIPDLLFVMTRDGTFSDYHAVSPSDLAAASEKIIGGNIRDFFDPALAEEITSHISEVLAAGQSITFRYSVPMPPDIRFYEAKMGVYGADKVIVVSRDITERKRAEDLLSKREADLNESQRLAHIGSWDWDAINDTIWWSDEYYCIYGIDPEKPTPNYAEHLKAYAPESAARLDDAVKRTMATGEPYELDLELAQPTEATRWIVARGEAKRDANGAIRGLRGTAQNITERKEAEDALRGSQAFIKNILESVDEGFIVVDREYRILSANRAFGRLVRSPDANPVGRFCYEVSHHIAKPCSESGEECVVKRTFETGTMHSTTHTHLEASGAKQYVELKSYPVTDASGRVVSAIETISDITEKRKLEEQLRQAQKMEAVGALAGGIAHDFNNILTAIIGYANILKMRTKQDDPLRRQVDPILTSSERAARLTQSLLTFSRNQVINPKPIDLNTIVANVEKLLARLIGEDIELTSRLSQEALIVMADTGQMEQVLLNLATNARDAMPEGGRLKISTAAADPDEEFKGLHGNSEAGRFAVLSVSDTGSGMDERTREKIFEPFFTTKEPGKGTGLGLAIVYGIVRQHNGIITVSSEPGKGATFRVHLPLVALPVWKDPSPPEAAPQGGKETLLLAEDDKEVRNLMMTVLQDYGYRVIDAADGQDAIDRFTENAAAVDLMILDVILPRKSGREVCSAARAIRPGVPVLFTSGHPQDVIRRKGVFEAGTEFIAKPVGPSDLLKKIRHVLDRGA